MDFGAGKQLSVITGGVRVMRRGRQEAERQEAEITAAATTTKKIQTKP